MTMPRRHIQGQVAMLTRRCVDRCFFLRPDDTINAIAAYEFARAALRNSIDIHAVMVMSNHPHVIVTDRIARRSDFMRDAMSGIARARNRDLNRRGYFWDAQSYGDTVLLNRDSVEEKILYVWLNPVIEGLVERVEDWPGFKIMPDDWGKPMTIRRPGSFYGRRSSETVTIIPKPPPGYEHLRQEEVAERFNKLIREAEDRILEERKKENKRVLGAKKVLAINPFSHPKTKAPMGKLNPRFACRDKELMQRAIADYKAFLEEYKRKRKEWATGKKVKFPCGTLWLRKNAGVKCCGPPDDEPGLATTVG